MEIDLDEPSRPQIAALLGISSRWIGELRSQGDMPADGATWAENLEAWMVRQSPKRGEAEEGALNEDQEQARLAKEQADRISMDNAERRRELASLPDMTSAVASVIEVSLARLMRVDAIVAKSDIALKGRIDTAISEALEELSATRVAELAGGGFDDGTEADEPDDESGDD